MIGILKKTLKLFLLFFVLGINSYAQIDITFPISRIVFQRNNQNSATFSVAGGYATDIDRVEARLLPINEGQGTETDWQTVQNSPTKGIYNGNITGKGGWYYLEVRGIKNNAVVSTTRIDRIGIGEVFLYAGQSNAEGNSIYPGATIGTTEDRVSCIDFVDFNLDEDKLPFVFSQMGDNKKVAPYNAVPWYWARLGAKLCEKLNVPVLFYGAALGGSYVSWWEKSANGQDLREEHSLFIKVVGMPYRGLKAGLQHYASRTGLRAILWHQGEADWNTPTQEYFNSLKNVIEHSRSDFEHNSLAWVVARVKNISGQNQVISQVPNVFAGPNTDELIPDIPAYRYIGHFANEGLNLAAKVWFDNLNDNFFNTTNPKAPSLLLPISVNCIAGNSDSQNQIELRPSDGPNTYRWVDGNTSKNRIVSGGAFTCRAQNANGFAYFTQSVYINPYFLSAPKISNIGLSNYCLNDLNSYITSDSQYMMQWNSGETSQSIRPTRSGNYYVTKYSPFGCSLRSNELNVTVYPIPKVSIVSNKETQICSGDSVLFAADTDYLAYKWSTGETTKTIIAKKEDTYSLAVKNEFGCESESVSKQLVVKALPDTPTISMNGFYTIDIVPTAAKVSADYFEWKNNSTILSNNKTQTLKLHDAGSYSVRAAKIYEIVNTKPLVCYSGFSNKLDFAVDAQDKGMGIFPNPTENGKLYLETLEDVENANFEVYDLKGNLYYEKHFDLINKKTEIDLKGLPKGYYILHIRSKYFNKSTRLILEY